jgi:condensin-2 complex subunit G2
VRTAVFNGMSFLLDNHLSHAILRLLLPQLHRLIDDRVAGVRVAFLDMLILVSFSCK